MLVVALRLLLPRRSPEVAPYCTVPVCASFYSSHRFGLPQLMLPLQSLGWSQLAI
jgi:hypothetical protein